ncbi:MAG: TfoX/Sxy family protein [Ottowia sp.]|nr:TfoX/Sxy family protein [Pseudomonadota bacterium]MCO5117943.1 TfoX/Sxy family protein [Burkholderiaceae bacterium]
MPTTLTADSEFAQYCCELLASLGPCRAYRMFGGLGIRTADGLNVALVTDLGEGDTLWLKADAQARADFEAQGCRRFTYLMKGAPRSMGYYSAPAQAMESPALMAPWAERALASALRARAGGAAKPRAGKSRRTSG